ncbi:MAG: ribosome small subunit-dependent GTPase A [Oscillospiraceae bacterium]
MVKGTIIKALSGFYYVECSNGTVCCKARGKFRREKVTPLVGDEVMIELTGENGVIFEVLPRRNVFVRPPVANIDRLVIIASAVIPVTDPFLIDRISAISENCGCEPVICVNKCDLNRGDELFGTYSGCGYITIRTSAVTGEGLDELRSVISGKVCAFTGNSGVGKSSILNALQPAFNVSVGEVSDRLGRGRHTTRHVELYRLDCGAAIMDTPGFSSFDTDLMELTSAENLQFAFHEFEPYIGKCRFSDCSHVKDEGCAILEALAEGKISPSRHASYVRLYEQIKQINEWEK